MPVGYIKYISSWGIMVGKATLNEKNYKYLYKYFDRPLNLGFVRLCMSQ
jgi:hypothetical protein